MREVRFKNYFLKFMILGLFASPLPSFAGSFYLELGGGLGQFRLADPFFPGAPLKTQYDISYAASLVANFGSGGAIESQAGFMFRNINGKDPGLGEVYNVTSLYPFYRIQLTKIYLSLGATPLVFKQSTTMPRTRVEGVSGLTELGLLFGITPKFSMNLATAIELVWAGDALSPKPIFSGILSFRFYFGQFGASGNTVSSNEFQGWRYPFGRNLK